MTVREPATYPAAWVPDDDPKRPWDDAAELAVEWVDIEARRLKLPTVLVTNTKGSQTFSGPLASFAQRSEHTTPRSRSVPVGTGPVLSYVPYGKELSYAISLARKTSLCIVETVSFPVRGWAAAVGATNLLNGERTPPPSPDLAKELDHLVFVGNNGYADEYGKRDAKRMLAELSRREDYDPAFIVGFLAAHQVSEHGLDRIQKLIDKVR